MQCQPQDNRRIILLVIGLAVLSVTTVQSDQTFSTLTPCKLHDANNSPCLRNFWQNVLINGITDVPGVKFTSIDPFKVKKGRLSANTPLINVNLEVKKVVVTGLAQSKIVDAKAINGEQFTLDMYIPKVHIKGNYAMDGGILVLNFAGQGRFEMDLADVELGFATNAKLVERDGEKFYDVISLKTDAKSLGHLHVKFENLFGDNQALTDSANEVFNQSWRELIEIMRPIIAESLDSALLGQMKKNFGNIPARIIFSDVS